MNPAEFANIARLEQTLWWYRGMERILYRFLDPIVEVHPMRDALEAGCGTGYMSGALQRRYGFRMTSLDLSEIGLRNARGFGLSKLAKADIRSLPFRDASFGALFSLDVIAHLDPAETPGTLREFARVVQPGGLVVVRASAFNILRSRHSMFVQERQRVTKRQMEKACASAGLEIVRLSYINSLLLPVALFKFRVWEPLTNAPPASGVTPVAPWLNRLFEVPLSIESAMIGVGIDLPVGQSLLLVAQRPIR